MAVNLDLYFFNIINGLAGRWGFLDFLGIFLAKYFEYFLLAFLVLFLLKDLKKYWPIAIESLLAVVFSRFVLTEIIRIIWFRPRPFVYNYVNLLLPDYNPNEASFPSAHASFYFALSTIIYSYNKKIGILFYIASSLIVITRVFVGLHWPSDILAGIVLGVSIGLIVNKSLKSKLSRLLSINP